MKAARTLAFRKPKLEAGGRQRRHARGSSQVLEDQLGVSQSICCNRRLQGQQQWKLKSAIYLQARDSADSCNMSLPTKRCQRP